jgi:5-methylcytosine-specific restriction protein A
MPERYPSRTPVPYRPRVNKQARRGYGTRPWSLLRKQVLVDQGFACASCGIITTSLEVDHILPHDGNLALFWNRTNLQGLCVLCHSRKTRRGL